MVVVWDDDERGPHKMPYTDDYEKEEEHVPIWKILKEYYDEEKEKLYLHPSSPPRLGAYNPTNYGYSNYEDEYEPSEDYDEGYTDDDEDSPKEMGETPSIVDEIPFEMKEIGDIIEKEIYKKFSYI